MKYLITGGSGFIGHNLAYALLADGHQVRVFDNGSRGSQSRLANCIGDSNFEFIHGDIRNENEVVAACQEVDSVIHLAYINGTEFFYSQPELILDIAVRGMLAVIMGCRHASVRELIMVSSSEVYQMPTQIPTDETVPLIIPDVHNPRFSYGGGKIISELMTINYGRNGFDRVMIIRPHNVYGPDMGNEHVIPQLTIRLAEMINERDVNSNESVDLMIQGDGNQTRAFIYIDDFISGMMKVIQRGKHHEIYHIGTMDETSIYDVAMEIASALQVKVNLKFSQKPLGSAQRRCPDIKKIKALGFEPVISMKQGIKKTCFWYYEYYKKMQGEICNEN